MLYLLTICYVAVFFLLCDIQENFKYKIMKIAWFNVVMLTPNFYVLQHGFSLWLDNCAQTTNQPTDRVK